MNLKNFALNIKELRIPRRLEISYIVTWESWRCIEAGIGLSYPKRRPVVKMTKAINCICHYYSQIGHLKRDFRPGRDFEAHGLNRYWANQQRKYRWGTKTHWIRTLWAHQAAYSGTLFVSELHRMPVVWTSNLDASVPRSICLRYLTKRWEKLLIGTSDIRAMMKMQAVLLLIVGILRTCSLTGGYFAISTLILVFNFNVQIVSW